MDFFLGVQLHFTINQIKIGGEQNELANIHIRNISSAGTKPRT